jgi:hypothetical protein
MMAISEKEVAIKAAEKKHGVLIDRSLFDLLIEKTREKYPRLSFVEARRYALNECHIWEKPKREAYNCALGKYFGPHGGYQAAKEIPRRIPKKSKLLIELEKRGQYKFVI